MSFSWSKHLQKNQEMIAQNEKLREEMQAKEEEHNKVLREVLTELKKHKTEAGQYR